MASVACLRLCRRTVGSCLIRSPGITSLSTIGIRTSLRCRSVSQLRNEHGLSKLRSANLLSPSQTPLSSRRHLVASSKIYDSVKHDTSKQPELGEYAPQKLSEDILTVPNVLTILRLVSTPLLGWWVLQDQMTYALSLLAISGTTDILDGYLARRYKSATVFGSIADPAADKALMTVMVGALAFRGLIPLPLVILIIGRDVGLVLSAFIIRWRTLPEPKTFSRYWDPRLPSAKVQPTQVSKYNTFLQIILVGLCTLLASMNDDWRIWWSSKKGLWHDESALPAKSNRAEWEAYLAQHGGESDWGDSAKKVWHAFMVVVAATTVWSGASYLSGTGATRYGGRTAVPK